MHHGTYVTHVPWCMPGSLTSSFLWNRSRGNVIGIPGACATRNFTYRVRGPWVSKAVNCCSKALIMKVLFFILLCRVRNLIYDLLPELCWALLPSPILRGVKWDRDETVLTLQWWIICWELSITHCNALYAVVFAITSYLNKTKPPLLLYF